MQYYQCITKGFAGTIARRVALSQVNWAEKEMWWQHHYHLARTGNWKSSIRERTESNVTKCLWQLVSLGKRDRPKYKGENVMAWCLLPSSTKITSPHQRRIQVHEVWYSCFSTSKAVWGICLKYIDTYMLKKKRSMPWYLNLLADKHCVVPSAAPY